MDANEQSACCETLAPETLLIDYKGVTYHFLWDAAVNGWRGWLLGEPLVIRVDPTGSGARPGEWVVGPFLISPDPSPEP